MSFPAAAREALADSQLRRNIGHATATIPLASSASRAQCTMPPAAVTAASKRSSCSGSVAIARALIALPASRNASQSGTSATAFARLVRMVEVALPTLRRNWESASVRREAAWKLIR